MIGKVIPKRATSSIAHLNDYILNRDDAGEAGCKVLFSGTFNMMCCEGGATW